MISTAALTDRSHFETTGADFTTNMNTFQWLLILGFPANVAAAQTMPELFTADDSCGASDEETARAVRLHADRARIGRAI
jgi:hypothetical protein